jgi:hypothetical protein
MNSINFGKCQAIFSDDQDSEANSLQLQVALLLEEY